MLVRSDPPEVKRSRAREVVASRAGVLKARQTVGAIPDDEGRLLMDDLDMLAAVARRARRRLRQGVFRRLLPPERQEVNRLCAAAHDEMARLADRSRRGCRGRTAGQPHESLSPCVTSAAVMMAIIFRLDAPRVKVGFTGRLLCRWVPSPPIIAAGPSSPLLLEQLF